MPQPIIKHVAMVFKVMVCSAYIAVLYTIVNAQKSRIRVTDGKNIRLVLNMLSCYTGAHEVSVTPRCLFRLDFVPMSARSPAANAGAKYACGLHARRDVLFG